MRYIASVHLFCVLAFFFSIRRCTLLLFAIRALSVAMNSARQFFASPRPVLRGDGAEFPLPDPAQVDYVYNP